MNKTLASAIDKLSSAPSNVAPFAVQNVFQALESSRSPPREIGVAFKACVDCDDKEAVEVALGGLARLVSRKGISLEDAIEILLANFYSAGVSCAPSIISTLTAFAQMEPRSSTSKQPWVQHPLTRAMIARPDTAPEVLSSVIRLILSSASDGQTAQKCIAFLYPCLSYILLAPSLSETEGSQNIAPVLASSLHSQLVRLACSKPVLQGPLLNVLVVHLQMHRTQLASIRAWLLPALADCIDAIECLEDEDSAKSVIMHCNQALVSMAQDMAEQGLPLSHVITALARLQSLEDSESCLVCFVWELGLLSMQAAGQDKGYCLALLTGILATQAPPVPTEPVCRMLTMCGLSATVHAVPAIRTQGATLLQSVQRLESANCASIPETPTVRKMTTSSQGFYGDQALVSQARTVLECLLASSERVETEMEACQWLEALHTSLDRGSEYEVMQGTPSQGRWSPLLLKDISTEPKIFSLPLMVALTSLLGHSSFKVQASAGRALGAAAKAFPLCGPTLLSSLLFYIKRAVERLCSGAIPAGTEISAAQTCLVLLSVVPSLATSQAATGAVLAALKPLTAAGTESDNLRCVAMRLLLAAWQQSGRAWPVIRALLLPNSQAESKLLRLTRATCVRDVCKTNGNHGIELVKPIEEALKDSNPGVVALGLEALAHLCESDHLDFYATWKVVVRILPTLPATSIVASKWIALLAYGALDAMVYPEAAVAVLELLWSASSHSSIAVRQQAYLALSRFPILLLENLEIDYSLQHYTSPLLSEAADLTVAAVEDLAGKALAYEHSRRRRQVEGGQGGRRAAMAAGSLMHRMTRVLPRQLCDAKTGSTFGPSPGALLLCFLPKGAPEGQKPADGPRERNAVPVQQLLDGYVQVFRDVCSTGIAGAGSFEARHVCLMIESWTQFLARWMLAAKSVKAEELAKQQGAKTVTAVHVSAIAANEVWEEIQRLWKMEDIIASESAALAAGSLAALLGPQHPSIVSECVKCLQQQLQSARRPSSQRVACAALGAAITGLHPTEWQSWTSAAELLKEKIKSPGEGSVIAAAAEALGAMVGALDANACVAGEEPSERCLRETSAVAECITLIMRELDSILHSTVNSIIQSALAAAPSAWAAHVCSAPSNATTCNLEAEQTGTAVTGLWRAVSLMTPAIWRQGGSSFLLTLFRGLTGHIKSTIGSFDQGGANPDDTWCLAGAVGTLPLLCEPLLKGELIDEMEVQNVISSLCCALKNKDLGMTSVWSRLIGSVSEVLGEMAALLIDCGILEDVDDIAELLVNGLQAPNSALQASAAMGCAAFLGAPVLACAVGHRRQARQHLMGSSSEQDSSKMKFMLSSIEDIALKGTEPRGRRAAAWAAAMLCAHARRELRIGIDVPQEQKLSDGSARSGIPESTHLPLHALPQDGAMFALVSYLNQGIQATSFQGMACAPGVLRCLARADRLPVMHWGGVCRKLMRTATVIAASNTELPAAAKMKREVRAAAAQLLLKHGHRTNLGLGELVEELIEQQRFESLEESLKIELLSALPALLASLSEERAVLVISALPALTATSVGTGVELAAWNGISACCVVKGLGSAQLLTHNSQHDGGHPQQYSAMTQTMSAMFRRLPGIPKWHAGEWKAAGGCAADMKGSLDSQLWEAALNCLSNVPSHIALAILPMSSNQGHEGPNDARSSFMRSQLAQRGKLPHREMSVCKNFCIDGPSSAVRTCVLAVASAFISAPQAVQEQNFRDALATVSRCSQPLQALELVACMAAVMASSPQAGVLPLGVKVLSSYSTEAALQTMPHNLPALLSHQLWQPSIEVVSEQLLAILRSTEGPMDDTFHSLADPMITSCLLAIRQHLQSDCWQFLAV